MNKKIVAGAVTLLSVAVLAACGKTSGSDKDIITMKGDTITVSEFYDKVKSNPSAQQVLLNLTIKEVFENIEIRLLDHIIISERGYFSFLEGGILWK